MIYNTLAWSVLWVQYEFHMSLIFGISEFKKIFCCWLRIEDDANSGMMLASGWKASQLQFQFSFIMLQHMQYPRPPLLPLNGKGEVCFSFYFPIASRLSPSFIMFILSLSQHCWFSSVQLSRTLLQIVCSCNYCWFIMLKNYPSKPFLRGKFHCNFWWWRSFSRTSPQTL